MKSEFSLALGGGAARGLAHIGVIQRLEELGKVPREISGTSIGAVIGAFYAAGYTSTDMKKIALDTNILKLVDLDFKHGFFKGNKIVKYLEKYLGEMEFSDLTIPLSIVATDIDTGEKVIFREGKVIDAIRSSISLPGIFRPYKYMGRSLIDGGIMENLPISLLSDKYPIVAVSVRMDFSKKSIKKIERIIPSGISNSYTILRKTLGIIMVNNENVSLKEHPNTFLIYPSREDIDFYDFGKMSPMIEEGYRVSESLVSYFSH